jgi:very-short-patch-repair endonuclease
MRFISIADLLSNPEERVFAECDFAEAAYRALCARRGVDPELVDGHVNGRRRVFNAGLNLCESPIERHMMPWLAFGNYGNIQHAPVVHDMADPFLPDRPIIIIPQFPFLNYRLDFAIMFKAKASMMIVALECDGREFHGAFAERERDAIRDGRLASWGISTVRASGTEIFQDPEQVMSRLLRRVREMREL